MKCKKIYWVHFKDELGTTGNYKPIQAYNKRSANLIFKSFEKYKDCKVLSIN